MDQRKRIELDPMPMMTSDGRDELNLAEFPLCALAHRLRPDQKSLRFEDQVRDESRGEMILRQLTVTAPDAYGLPTALDDEVLLGLIQLTRLRGFADRKVPFTRYQLIGLLGWRNETKSYERLEASLNRWTGVTLYYRNAWWNKARQCWVDETFHVLDNVWLCHRGDRRDGVECAEDGSLLSAFVWNEVLFRSFQAGNLKSLDFDFFRRLDSAVAKRLYRFLDKRFFRRPHLEFDLKQLAWEHIGLARCYDAASLKRKLRPGIVELEQKGYLQATSEADRFRKVGAGQWSVAFAKAASANVPAATPADSPATQAPLAIALVQRGVTPTTAGKTVQQYPPERIATQLEVFDWLVQQQDPKISRNPPGFLISAIKGDYTPPRDFVSRAEQVRIEQQAAERNKQRQARQRALAARQHAQEIEREQATRRFWQSLSPEEARQAQTEALTQAPGLKRKFLERGGSAGDAARKAVLDAYALSRLQTTR